jgi:hypothetical protein
MVSQLSFLKSLFGKKRTVTKRKVSKKKAVPRPTKLVRKKAKKLGVRIKTKFGYKKESILNKQIRRAERIRLKKKMLLKKRAAAKKVKSAKSVKKTVKRRRKRSTRFGSSDYVPLSQIMSPYPMSVMSSPPFV